MTTVMELKSLEMRIYSSIVGAKWMAYEDIVQGALRRANSEYRSVSDVNQDVTTVASQVLREKS